MNRASIVTFLTLCGLLACNVLTVTTRMADRPGASLWLIFASVLAALLWAIQVRSRPIVAFAIGMPVLVVAVLVLQHAFMALFEALGVASALRLGAAVVLSAVEPVLFYGLGRWTWQRLRRDQLGDAVVAKQQGHRPFMGTTRWLVWGTVLVCFIVGAYLFAVYDRPGILGWDTPNYVWRSRLIGQSGGLMAHVLRYDNGLQLAFPSLVALLHAGTGWDYWDAVQILSIVLAAVACLALGALAYKATGSWLAATASTILAAGFFPTARFVADMRDNLAALTFGTLALLLFAAGRPSRKSSWRYEWSAALFLVLTGFTHTAMAALFLLIAGIVGFIEFLDVRRSGERGSLWKDLLRCMAMPVICALLVGVAFAPTASTYVGSITQFGMDATALGDTAQLDFRWLAEQLQLATYWPWVLIGVLALAAVLFGNKGSRTHRVLYVWCTVGLSLYLLLSGRLAYRYFMMIPLPVIFGLGVHHAWQLTRHWTRHARLAAQALTLIVVFGLVLPVNFAAAYQAINTRTTWASESTLGQLASVVRYIERQNLPPPYLFLIENQQYPMAFSVLYDNMVRATVPADAILDSYVVLGDLASFLEKQPTSWDQPELNWTSQYWWRILERDQVLARPGATAFILKDMNPDLYDSYLFETVVDDIGPDTLVVDSSGCSDTSSESLGSTPGAEHAGP